MDAKVKTLDELVAEVKAATVALEEREREEGEASRLKYSARTRLNEAQKALDVAIAAAKKGAPRDSVWGEAARTKPVSGGPA